MWGGGGARPPFGFVIACVEHGHVCVCVCVCVCLQACGCVGVWVQVWVFGFVHVHACACVRVRALVSREGDTPTHTHTHTPDVGRLVHERRLDSDCASHLHHTPALGLGHGQVEGGHAHRVQKGPGTRARRREVAHCT